jgi:hypothetical protein
MFYIRFVLLVAVALSCRVTVSAQFISSCVEFGEIAGQCSETGKRITIRNKCYVKTISATVVKVTERNNEKTGFTDYTNSNPILISGLQPQETRLLDCGGCTDPRGNEHCISYRAVKVWAVDSVKGGD